MDVSVGYGYRAWQAGVWLVVFWLIGWAVFADTEMHATKPSDELPPFYAAVYSLDVLLPIVDLGQQTFRVPADLPAQGWLWTSIVVGWILTTAVVAALSGLLKRA